jgi:hypothetical protein
VCKYAKGGPAARQQTTCSRPCWNRTHALTGQMLRMGVDGHTLANLKRAQVDTDSLLASESERIRSRGAGRRGANGGPASWLVPSDWFDRCREAANGKAERRGGEPDVQTFVL